MADIEGTTIKKTDLTRKLSDIFPGEETESTLMEWINLVEVDIGEHKTTIEDWYAQTDEDLAKYVEFMEYIQDK